MEEWPDDQPLPIPEIPDWQQFAWKAWQRLNKDRAWYGGGMSGPIPGHITWKQVQEWADYHDQDVQLLDCCINAMDEVYISYHAEKMRAASQ